MEIFQLILNPYKPSILFVGHRQTVQTQDQMQHSAASDQGLHCLLTDCSIKILIKMKNITQSPLMRNGSSNLYKGRQSIGLQWVKTVSAKTDCYFCHHSVVSKAEPKLISNITAKFEVGDFFLNVRYHISVVGRPSKVLVLKSNPPF